MSLGDAPSALTSYRPGCVGLRAARKRPGKGQAALRDSVTLAGGWGTPTAQGVSLQTQTRTQEPRILDPSRLPRPRAEAASWLPYFPTENSPGLSGPSARHVETQRPRQQRPTWRWSANSTGPVEPGCGLNSRVRGQLNLFQGFLIQQIKWSE
ncbi:uncharacterized protein LOC126944988 [Macaca thibetana thibetana]|uniref:uncharacterized protein LOC126944988 n=1 Tax=Macaca thibetana thibetana TaxID=257877 RepID=UPI0021BC990E|nr:uncharacterized protein LOC126944988 [Macaca thibetana thibetana]